MAHGKGTKKGTTTSKAGEKGNYRKETKEERKLRLQRQAEAREACFRALPYAGGVLFVLMVIFALYVRTIPPKVRPEKPKPILNQEEMQKFAADVMKPPPAAVKPEEPKPTPKVEEVIETLDLDDEKPKAKVVQDIVMEEIVEEEAKEESAAEVPPAEEQPVEPVEEEKPAEPVEEEPPAEPVEEEHPTESEQPVVTEETGGGEGGGEAAGNEAEGEAAEENAEVAPAGEEL